MMHRVSMERLLPMNKAAHYNQGQTRTPKTITWFGTRKLKHFLPPTAYISTKLQIQKMTCLDRFCTQMSLDFTVPQWTVKDKMKGLSHMTGKEPESMQSKMDFLYQEIILH